MDIENIISVFSRLSGSDEETSVNFRFMCENAKDYIISHLKPDSDVNSCCGKLEFAAAALAYYRYILWSITESGGDITVGDISVKSSSSILANAQKICEQAFSDISDVFDNGYFVFGVM